MLAELDGGVGVSASGLSALPGMLQAYRDLVGDEARLADALRADGLRIGASVVAQWPVVHDHLQLFARGFGRAGLLVLAGAPDDASRHTGLPFLGPRDARERLGLDVEGDASSPGASAFWDVVGEAPLEALYGAVHVAHACPFDAPDHVATRRAAAKHVLTLLDVARPQAVVALGARALGTLADALGDRDLAGLARAPEASWLARWPAGTRPLRLPSAEVPARPPFRVRVAPLPDLAGPAAGQAKEALGALLRFALP